MKRVIGLALAAMLAGAGMAQAEWPEKPVKLVVPFKPGGTSDQMARVLQASLEDAGALAQPLTVVNVGGHYSIGSRQVLEAEADGYNFLIIHIALMGGEGTGALDFSWRDFKPVAATGEFCLAPMVRKDSGIETVEQLLEKVKAEPDTMIFGANLGAINHMAGIMLQNLEEGAKFRFVQIGGGTANFTALTGNQTGATVLSGAEVVNFTLLPDGSENPDSQIRPLAYTGSERFDGLPDLPTMKELGYDMNFCVKNWIFAPKETPDEVVEKFNAALEQATQTDRYQEFLTSKGFAPTFLTGADLQADLDATWEAIEPVAKQAAQK
ncbi:tripartite tricarboxylate transporter substrate binding protein [Sulfitobacter sp. D35]|uniref:tripartite tricarboxylate transporter substrate binding protein n=1 Tax=Sulfitobacter sp. D35 TaxID=3083252 RepID=UPI00296E92FF|nr:tripartite tricarboxylate transporter substrate binding protein [Sulfitobacter sp. D35]MDW4497216.1 tripartite tricarboxylate transporter substrate binding protein [Sulfitobacter sp. D35]